jgi:uncharacterized membrane protein
LRRNESKTKIKAILQEISQAKVEESRRMRVQSKELAKKIAESREKEFEVRRQMRNKVVEFEKEFK